MTEYQLPDGTERLVAADVVLEGDDTVEVDARRAEELGLEPVEPFKCDECGDTFDTNQGLSNHERTHEE